MRLRIVLLDVLQGMSLAGIQDGNGIDISLPEMDTLGAASFDVPSFQRSFDEHPTGGPFWQVKSYSVVF